MNLDGRGGLEVLVAVQAGAYTTSYGVIAYHSGRLVRLRIPSTSGVRDSFHAGGSVSYASAFGCLGHARVAQSDWSWRAPKTIDRAVYRLVGTTWRLVRRVAFRYKRLPRFPELSRRPFARC